MKQFNLEHNSKINTGFKVPEHYFEQFEAKMMDQIINKNEAKVVFLFYKKQIWISAVAAVILFAVAIPIYFNMASESNLDAVTIENYLSQQQNISTNDLMLHLSDQDITALENNLSLNETNADVIEDYLSESENLDYYINEQ